MSDQLFIMEGEGVVKIYNGNYSEYRISLDQPKVKVETKKASTTTPEAPIKTVKKLSFKEQKELEDSEKAMSSTEEKIVALTESLLKIDATDYIKIQEVTNEIDSLKVALDEYTLRWLELSE